MVMKRRKDPWLKASNLFDDEDDELNEIDIKDEEEMAFLSKKLQKILRDKRNKEERKTLLKKKNVNRNDQGGSSNIHNLHTLNARNPNTSNWIALSTLKGCWKMRKEKGN